MSNNNHWHYRSCAVDYPLADSATAIADSGARLPSDLLADLHLRYPAEFGEFPFVGAVSLSARVVSVVIEAAHSLTPDYGLAPLAVLTLPRSAVEPGRQLALAAQSAGVAGWIAFGDGVREYDSDGVSPLSLRFSTPQQSLLAPRAARRYRALPVRSLSSYTASAPLSGIVQLSADDPLEVVRATREIGGVTRDVAVIRLTRGGAGGGFESSAQEEALDKLARVDDLLYRLAGPCGGRPESRTCGDPQPVEFIGAVGPDCDGVLTLDFRGCAEVEHVADPCTLLLRCGFGIGQVCARPFIPDDDGLLPGDYPPAVIEPPGTDSDSDSESEDSESRSYAEELPFVECFDGEPVVDFVSRSGSWAVVSDDSPYELDYCPYSYTRDGTSIDVSEAQGSYESDDLSTRNLTLWEGFDSSNLGRVTVTDLKMMPTAARHNGGLVLNYRPHLTIPGRVVYFTVEVDYDSQEIRLRRFNGLDYVPVASVAVPGIILERWFRVSATVVEGPVGGQTRLTARVEDLEGSLDVTIGPLDVSAYAPSSGFNGLFADRARTRFSFFHYAEAE